MAEATYLLERQIISASDQDIIVDKTNLIANVINYFRTCKAIKY